MKTLKTALQLFLSELQKLSVPAVATAVAGIAAPIVAKALGADITPAEVAGWLAIVGTVAGVVHKLVTGQAQAKVKADALRERIPSRL